MNPFAYRTTGLAIQTLSKLSKANIRIHGGEHVKGGPTIFVINHFTRLETLLMPYHIHRLNRVPVWSLADSGLFIGAFGSFLEKLGAVSTRHPDRDRLIVKSLLTGEASWIIFPEGRMVKNKKIIEKGNFVVSFAGGKHPPHTGAATLALRTEFYRQRIRTLSAAAPEEAHRVMTDFGIASVNEITETSTRIVPVNITYYPIRAKENAISGLARQFVDNLPDRAVDEMMTEGTMLFEGVDIDIRFGEPISVEECIHCRTIKRDVDSHKKIGFDDVIPSRSLMRKEAVKIMQRYMTAIYRMTTVNFDHLFASMLKHLPYNRIDEQALKRKVFLVAHSGLEAGDVLFHSSLKADGTHLLSDDRFNNYNDFLSLALDKEIIRKQGRVLIKNHTKFAAPFDYDRSRMDNPVAVIANEVEPLAALQKKIKLIAWMPDYWVRKKVAHKLMVAAEDEFQKDYQKFYVDGESKSQDVGKPYLIKGRRGGVGVVLLHGYMAAPLEVKGLAEYLGRQGIWVYVPRLKGHGTSPEDLATRKHTDWTASVDLGFALIQSLCKQVVVGGFSTGAGLALDLADRARHIKGIFAVSPPMRLHDFSAKFVPAVDTWNRLMKVIHLEEAQKEFVENRPENPHINYMRNPLSGVRELVDFMEMLVPKLTQITAPTLIIQSWRDPVVNPEGTGKIFKLLGSPEKSYLLVNIDRHGILLGEGSHHVYQAIHNFIRSL